MSSADALSTGPAGARRVVVGTGDGLDGSGALDWAVAWAVRHSARVEVLSERGSDLTTQQRLVAEVVTRRAGGERLLVESALGDEATGPGLLHLARTADLLVLPAGRSDPSAPWRPGRVLRHCLTHATCPVLVVPGTGRAPSGPWTYAVGVDGSARARAALNRARWDAAQGSSPGDVQLITVVEDPKHGWPTEPAWTRPWARARRDAEDHRTATSASSRSSDPRLRHSIVPGAPEDVLPQLAAAADLLVLGAPARRMHRGWWRTSTVRGCMDRSDVPVLMVPLHDDHRARQRP